MSNASNLQGFGDAVLPVEGGGMEFHYRSKSLAFCCTNDPGQHDEDFTSLSGAKNSRGLDHTHSSSVKEHLMPLSAFERAGTDGIALIEKHLR